MRPAAAAWRGAPRRDATRRARAARVAPRARARHHPLRCARPSQAQPGRRARDFTFNATRDRDALAESGDRVGPAVLAAGVPRGGAAARRGVWAGPTCLAERATLTLPAPPRRFWTGRESPCRENLVGVATPSKLLFSAAPLIPLKSLLASRHSSRHRAQSPGGPDTWPGQDQSGCSRPYARVGPRGRRATPSRGRPGRPGPRAAAGSMVRGRGGAGLGSSLTPPSPRGIPLAIVKVHSHPPLALAPVYGAAGCGAGHGPGRISCPDRPGRRGARRDPRWPGLESSSVASPSLAPPYPLDVAPCQCSALWGRS